MRKYLGVLAGVVVFCVMSWAQAPTEAPAPAQTPAPTTEQAPAPAPTTAPATEQAPAPTQVAEAVEIPPPAHKPPPPPRPYPIVELFAGGSYAKAGLFNSGYWAGLPGWDVSLGLNMARWLGFVVEGGQYYGTSKISKNSSQWPFQSCPDFCPTGTTTFKVTTREYNFLFGLQFARRKYERWTPFGELLYGHQGTRGEASGNGATETKVGTGRALVAGGGADFKINPRFALRFKADYFQTGTRFPAVNQIPSVRKKQDNIRFSIGIVIRNVHKKKRTLEDETQLAP